MSQCEKDRKTFGLDSKKLHFAAIILDMKALCISILMGRATFSIFIAAMLAIIAGCTGAVKDSASQDSPESATTNSLPGVEVSLQSLLSEKRLGLDDDPQSEVVLAEAKLYLEFLQSKTTKKPVEALCQQAPNSVVCLSLTRDRWKWPPFENHGPAGGFNLSTARKGAVKGDFAAVANLNLNQTIRLSKSLGKAQLFVAAEALVKGETCLASALYLGFGASLDSHFSEPEAAPLAKQVFAKAISCHTDEAALRAGFRLAMMYQLEDNCGASIPVLRQLAEAPAGKALRQRVQYWQNRCQSSPEREPAQKQEGPPVILTEASEEEIDDSQWPLTYHGILLKQTDQAGTFIKPLVRIEAPPPSVRFRLGKPEIDGIVQTAEAFLSLGKRELARTTLEKINLEELLTEEPKFQLYVSALFHRTESGLGTFRVMSRLFGRVPSLKNEVTLKLYYPTWYLEEIRAAAEENQLDPYLLISIVRQESAFNRMARSPRNAKGLMQLLPSTAKLMGLKRDENLYDVTPNIRVGAKFFRKLMDRFDGKTHLALAAYNAGPGAVAQWLRRYPTTDATLFMDLIPYRETREYTASILRNWHWYKALYAPGEGEQPGLAFYSPKLDH